jgi:serine/threonine protein kinase
MALNLCTFGWDDAIIPANLANLCKHLPTWSQLKTLRDPVPLGSHEVYFPHHYFHDLSGTQYMPAFQKGELYNDDGGYSQVFKAQRTVFKPVGDKYGNVRLDRTGPFIEMCIKEIALQVEPDDSETVYNDEIKAILYEAYLHALVQKTLEKTALKSCVPALHEIVATTTTGEQAASPKEIASIWMTMELLNGQTLEKFLKRKFSTGTKESNTKLLKEILLQLAAILYILQSSLNFNHRDLKINNVYVRAASGASAATAAGAAAAVPRTATVPGIGTFEYTTEIVMLDFGFSCIACGSGFINPRASLLSAGSYFRAEDDCLKKGRDLAQFLYSLHCFYPLQEAVTPAFFEILHAAMKATRRDRSYDLLMGLDSIGTPLVHATLPRSIKYNNGIYLFLRNNDVDVPGCEPLTLASAIMATALPA